MFMVDKKRDLFKKVTQKMKEAGVMPLPHTKSVSSTCIQYTQRFDFTQD